MIGNSVGHRFLAAVFGDGQVGSEGTAAKSAKVDVELDVAVDAQGPGNAAGCLDLDEMALTVADGQGVKLANPASRASASAVAESSPPLKRMTAGGFAGMDRLAPS